MMTNKNGLEILAHNLLMDKVAEYDYREDCIELIKELDTDEYRPIMTLLGFATKPDQLLAALESNPNIQTFVLLEELVNRHVKKLSNTDEFRYNAAWGQDIIERLGNYAVSMMEDNTWEWD